MLQRIPGGFQQQSLLRLHQGRFYRCNTEKLGIKLIYIIHQAIGFGVQFANRLRIGIIKIVSHPTLIHHIHNGVLAIFQQLPESLRAVGTAGQATAQADNGNGFVFFFFQPLNRILRFFQFFKSLF